MKALLFIIAFVSCFLNFQPLSASEEDRPKIGLVLSGGGARGAAHAGVLKVLEEYRIPIDVITGTSMGSIVGGLYASGLSPDQIIEALENMDWSRALNDNVTRPESNYINKVVSEKFSTDLKLGINSGGVALPSGAIQGQNIRLMLQALTSHVAHVDNFDDFPIPFRAVATNIVNGNMEVLSGGDLAKAMRASMSVPGAFAPEVIDGITLVDGGLSNNLPIDIAQQMGADIIIAIDISTPLLDAEDIVNVLDISLQTTGFLTRINTEQRLAMLTEQDVLIIPELGNLGTASFDRATEAIPLGEIAARASEVELRALSLNEADYAAYRASFTEIPPVNNTIRSITIENDSKLNINVIAERLDTVVGDEINLDALEAEVRSVHAIGNFETVGYRLNHNPQGVDLIYDAKAKSWGPNYLFVGVEMDGNMDGDHRTNFNVGLSREELNDKGAIWTTILTIGEDPLLETQFYQPLTNGLGPFLLTTVSTGRENRSVFEGDDEILEYRLELSEASIGLGYEFSAKAAVVFGVDRLTGKSKVRVGDPLAEEPDFDDGGFYSRFRYDSMDDRFYPQSGTYIDAWAHASLTSFDANEELQQWIIRAVNVRSFGQHRLGFSIFAAGTENGTSTVARRFSVGGLINLSGLKPDQLFGQNAAVIKTIYYREYEPLPFLSGYIGGTLEYGGAWEDRDDISADTAIGSASIFAAATTPLGPVQVGVGFTDKGDINYFTRIGYLF